MHQNKALFSSPFHLIKPSYPNHVCVTGKGCFNSADPGPLSLHRGGQNQSLKIHRIQKYRASLKMAEVAHCAPGLVFNLLWEVAMWDGSLTALIKLMQSVTVSVPLLQSAAAECDFRPAKPLGYTPVSSDTIEQWWWNKVLSQGEMSLWQVRYARIKLWAPFADGNLDWDCPFISAILG